MRLPGVVSLILIGIGPLLSGCTGSQDDLPKGLIHRAAVRLDPKVLDAFVGTYQLPSGALFPVVSDGERLLGGTPPYELLPQTTRRFVSNRLPGEFHFDRSDDGRVRRMNHRLAKQDHWAERVDSETTADPTRMVDAGGHRLRMLVSGEGQPTIVLDDGFGAGIDHHAALHARLSKLSRVVAYDHAGTGGSDTGPEPRDARQVAQELRRALASAELEPPFVLVGSSIGAEYIRIFAHQYRGDVAGLVMLDPAPDWDALFEWAETNAPTRVDMYRRIHDDADRWMTELMRHQEPARQAEWTSLDATRRQAREALPLAGIPIVQITGAVGQRTSFIMDDKFRFFDAWLKHHIPHARHVRASHSGHAVEIGDAELVEQEVRRMISDL